VSLSVKELVRVTAVSLVPSVFEAQCTGCYHPHPLSLCILSLSPKADTHLLFHREWKAEL